MGVMIGAAISLAIEQTGSPVASVLHYGITDMGEMVAGVTGAVMALIITLIEMTGKLSPSLPLLFSIT